MASPLSKPPMDDAGHVPITEEFDSFKHTLPSPGPIVIGLVLVVVAVGAVLFFFRATPAAAGSINDAFAVSLPNQSTVLATVQLTLRNVTVKPIVLKNVNITVRTETGEFSDDFGSVSDFGRYFQALPELQQHSIQGLARDITLAPGTQLAGSVIVSFPITKQAFDSRRGLIATVSFYDHRPIEIKR